MRILFKIAAIFLLLNSLLACSAKTYYKGPSSDHFDGHHFHNAEKDPYDGFSSFLYWKMTSKREAWPKNKNALLDIPPERVWGDEMRVSYVGHATTLIQTQGINILTDPVWSDWVGPDHWASVERVAPPGIAWETLPPIDVVLISHSHYDHLDIPTLKKLWQRDHPLILAPLGTDTIVSEQDSSIQIQTLDWYQYIKFDNQTAIYLEPAQHWTRRYINDRDKALWAGYVISTAGGNIYFAGDTGYAEGENFHRIQKKHGDFRLSLLPIGCYAPRWYLSFQHLDPHEAVLAHKILASSSSLGIHYDTFQLGDEKYNQPITELALARKQYQVEEHEFRALKTGQSWYIPAEPPFDSR